MWCISDKESTQYYCAPILAALQLSPAHPPGRWVRKLSAVTSTQKVPSKADKAPWIQQRWHHAAQNSPVQPPGLVFSTVWTRPQLSGPLFSVHLGETPYFTPTALAVCSQAAAEGDAPHSSKALLEPSDLSVRAYLTPLQQPRDPVSPAAGPQSKSARCVPHPLSGERRSSAAACSPMRLSHLHDQQLSFRRPAPSPPRVTCNCVLDNVSP